MIGGHVFVDESKVKDYLLVSTVISGDALEPTRRAIRALMLPGQPRLHMKQESDSRRKQILAVIAELDVEGTVYRAPADGRVEDRTAVGRICFRGHRVVVSATLRRASRGDRQTSARGGTAPVVPRQE